MALSYRLFAGGTIGHGKQWISWMHIDDATDAMLYLLENEAIEGQVNFTAPNPVTMEEFGKTIGAVLHRPHWLPVPAFALKLALGEMSVLVLKGQKVLPSKLLENGYSFRFPNVKEALTDIYNRK